ncbi:flagellar protein FlaG [Sulfurimonas microaerophilic]|uniref:flagellar protein FlaG n=1 Tax=Sulfurimonas microaerophilic TaxID=3058392 RepID=UPI002714E0C7|nr:flagellar protein FlaG [Sulfurimonas sp. hsl 1-7]
MDGIANVAKQQQTQMGAQELQGRSIEQNQSTQLQQQDIVKEVQQNNVDSVKKLNSKEDVERLVKQLNEALAPISTNIKFGVDSQDIFYVSVIEAKSNKMIRRFPAEDAQIVLPKMQEVNGILFDSKG